MAELNNLTPEYKEALIDLLFQVADDDFIHSYRGSEWLGLAPHIEEDVAYSSISQDTMGHAAMFYTLLEGLEVGDADALAHDRKAEARKNAIVLEFKNGTGHYMKEPKYDWAFAVVRNYIYSSVKYIKMSSLKTSSYEPLSDVSTKVLMELYYHQLHWKTWFFQLLTANEDATNRMKAAIERVSNDLGGLFSLGENKQKLVEYGLIEDEEVLKQRWVEFVAPVFESVSLEVPTQFGLVSGNGRNGEHTNELAEALEVLGEVYNEFPQVAW